MEVEVARGGVGLRTQAEAAELGGDVRGDDETAFQRQREGRRPGRR